MGRVGAALVGVEGGWTLLALRASVRAFALARGLHLIPAALPTGKTILGRFCRRTAMKPGKDDRRSEKAGGIGRAKRAGAKRNAARLCPPEALEARALMAADGQHMRVGMNLENIVD